MDGADMEQLRRRDGEHGHPHPEPADLGEGDEHRGQLGPRRPEGTLCQQVQGQPRVAAHIGQRPGVRPQDDAADDHRPEKGAQVQPVAQLGPHAHAGGEEGKAHHHHKHAPKPFPGAGRDLLKGIIIVRLELLLLFCHCAASSIVRLSQHTISQFVSFFHKNFGLAAKIFLEENFNPFFIFPYGIFNPESV